MKSICLLLICTIQVLFIIRFRSERTKALTIISPSLIFTVGVMARFGLGSLIMGFTPEELVIEGEYRQYQVSWLYSQEVAEIWCIYLLSASFIFALCEIGSRLITRERKHWGSEGGGWFKWIEEVKRDGLRAGKKIRILDVLLLTIFFVAALVSGWTGSMDRGQGYQYWATMPFRPEAAFIAFSRFKQIGYFLLPLSWGGASTLAKTLMGATAGIPLVIEIITGGRGAVLYPVIMVFFGKVVLEKNLRKIVSYLLLSMLIAGLSIPYIAAYRDSKIISERDHKDVVGRLAGFFSKVDTDRVTYRYMALGREIYACSDGFIIEDSIKNRKEAGFRDLNLGLMRKLLIPRWAAEDQEYEKADGARIAKNLIGVKNKSWFPCITTPGDLFRRGRWVGVIFGGLLLGGFFWLLDMVWIMNGERMKSTSTLMLTLLPVTYVQAGVYGTVQEVIWQFLWELPKYLVAAWITGKALDLLVEKFGAQGRYGAK